MEIYEGQKKTFQRYIADSLVRDYAKLSGDFNPLHLDEEYAKTTLFKGRIAHGMLAGALISSVLGCEFPGKGTIYLKQDMKFIAPIYIDTYVTINVVVNKIDEKSRCLLQTNIYDEKEKLLVKGEAYVQLA